jgi:hypothetical protein
MFYAWVSLLNSFSLHNFSRPLKSVTSQEKATKSFGCLKYGHSSWKPSPEISHLPLLLTDRLKHNCLPVPEQFEA